MSCKSFKSSNILLKFRLNVCIFANECQQLAQTAPTRRIHLAAIVQMKQWPCELRDMHWQPHPSNRRPLLVHRALKNTGHLGELGSIVFRQVYARTVSRLAKLIIRCLAKE